MKEIYQQDAADARHPQFVEEGNEWNLLKSGTTIIRSLG